MMVSRVKELHQKGLIKPPNWLPDNMHYEVITGSVSYAVSSDTSDMDIVGFCIPEKKIIFPHLAGEVEGFGSKTPRFENWQQHHIMDGKQEYDFSIYSIVKFFDLLMENNPNMCDIIFTPQRCVLFSSKIAQLVRDNRKMFLHKGSYHKFKGYAFASLKKLKQGSNSSNPKRKADIETHGLDTKFAYHIIRLASECEQILTEHDLDIEKNAEILKSVRRGEWDLDRIEKWFSEKEISLNELYNKSTLQHSPDEEAIKRLLLNCLEMHYGDLSHAVSLKSEGDKLASEMFSLLNNMGYYS